MNLFRVSAAFVLAAGIALTSATVQAGENISPERLVGVSREFKLFDRPDLLNSLLKDIERAGFTDPAARIGYKEAAARLH